MSEHRGGDFSPHCDNPVDELRRFPMEARVNSHWNRNCCIRLINGGRNGVRKLATDFLPVLVDAIWPYPIASEEIEKIRSEERRVGKECNSQGQTYRKKY